MNENTSTFKSFWLEYQSQSKKSRQKYYDSLSLSERRSLVRSFWDEGWYEVVVQNEIDKRLDYVKIVYGIDLIELRLKLLRSDYVFLVNRDVWDYIEDIFTEFDNYYNIDVLFGGLVVTTCGRDRRFYRVKSKTIRREYGP